MAGLNWWRLKGGVEFRNTLTNIRHQDSGNIEDLNQGSCDVRKLTVTIVNKKKHKSHKNNNRF